MPLVLNLSASFTTNDPTSLKYSSQLSYSLSKTTISFIDHSFCVLFSSNFCLFLMAAFKNIPCGFEIKPSFKICFSFKFTSSLLVLVKNLSSGFAWSLQKVFILGVNSASPKASGSNLDFFVRCLADFVEVIALAVDSDYRWEVLYCEPCDCLWS